MRAWAGRSEDELVELGERLFVQGIAGSLYPEAWRLVDARTCGPGTPSSSRRRRPASRWSRRRARSASSTSWSPRCEIEDGICTGRPRRAACSGGPARPTAVQSLRRRARHRPGAELRLLQRRRGRPVPAHRRPAAGAQPRPRAGRRRAGTTAGRSPASGPAAAGGPRRDRAHGGRRRRACWAASAPGVALGALNGSRREAVDLGIALGGRAGQRRWPACGSTSQGAEHLAARPGGLPVQPPEPARRAGAREAAPRRLHRRRQEGAGERPGLRAGVPARRRRVRRPRRPGAGAGGAGARGAAPARGDLAGHRAGGDPVGDADARPVQEGRLPRRDAGRACRSCRS